MLPFPLAEAARGLTDDSRISDQFRRPVGGLTEPRPRLLAALHPSTPPRHSPFFRDPVPCRRPIRGAGLNAATAMLNLGCRGDAGQAIQAAPRPAPPRGILGGEGSPVPQKSLMANTRRPAQPGHCQPGGPLAKMSQQYKAIQNTPSVLVCFCFQARPHDAWPRVR